MGTVYLLDKTPLLKVFSLPDLPRHTGKNGAQGGMAGPLHTLPPNVVTRILFS
jgi:hypothetical protein